VTILASAVACTTVIYDGPRPRKDAIAYLTEGRHVRILSIDGREVPSGLLRSYEFDGCSATVVDVQVELNPAPVMLCFAPQPGHHYVVKANERAGESDVDDWVPVLFDRDTQQDVPIECPVPGDYDVTLPLAHSRSAASPPRTARASQRDPLRRGCQLQRRPTASSFLRGRRPALSTAWSGQ
jgi:hypothetical protein